LSEHTAHRQIVYYRLPRKRVNRRWLERTPEDARRLCNTAHDERIDCHRKTGKGLTCVEQRKCGHADIHAGHEIRRRGLLAPLHGQGVAVGRPVNREDIPRLAA